MENNSTHFGVELDFGDHKETSWWWGQPSGFWDWFDKIGVDFHPKLKTKRAVIKNIVIQKTDKEVVRG